MNHRSQQVVIVSETRAVAPACPRALRRARGVLRRLGRDQRGANFVEYGVLVALVALTGMTFLPTFAGTISTAFQNLGDQIKQIGSSGASGPAAGTPAGASRAAAQ